MSPERLPSTARAPKLLPVPRGALVKELRVRRSGAADQVWDGKNPLNLIRVMPAKGQDRSCEALSLSKASDQVSSAAFGEARRSHAAFLFKSTDLAIRQGARP